MKKLAAFLTALALCLFTAACLRFVLSSSSLVPKASFGTWGNETKTKALKGVEERLDSESLLVFGSSEFMHGTDTPYHPASMFAKTDCSPALLGAGYYQSLSHAIALSALTSGHYRPNKAVLLLSPQWFRKPGVLPEAFSSRFSESDYMGMLQNPLVSREAKNYMEQRASLLLENSPKTQKRLSSYHRVWRTQTACGDEVFSAKAREAFLGERERVSLPVLYTMEKLGSKIPGFSRIVPASPSASGPYELEGNLPRKGLAPDFRAYEKQAELDGKRYQENEFYMDQKSYDRLKPFLKKKKGISKNAVKGYAVSPEYDDLKCFLQVCQDLSIEPLLVILPVNGYYYDYTGFPREARQNYYKKISAIAKEYGAKTADFSGDEYTKYFFEDRVHLGRKGWVMVNESLYQYFKEKPDTV